jgi:hypothetical protein
MYLFFVSLLGHVAGHFFAKTGLHGLLKNSLKSYIKSYIYGLAFK